MSFWCRVVLDAGCSGHLKTDCSLIGNQTCFMQLTEPLRVLILNGPGINRLIRTLPFFARPTDELLEWEMVTDDDSRNYLQIRSHNYRVSDRMTPIKVVGRIIGWGLPERNQRLSQDEYYQHNVVIEAQNVDEQWYYYVGDYLRDTNRFGKGTIYTADQYKLISTTCPRENPPPRIYQGDDVSIITPVKQRRMVL